MDTMTTVFTDNAKVMPKGQVTIPKDVRKALGVEAGDRVTFVVSQGRGENHQFSGLCDETFTGGYARAGRSSSDSERGRCYEACKSVRAEE